MATAAQIETRVLSSMLLNVAAGLMSSMLIYVSFTETRHTMANWPFLAAWVVLSGVIFEWGRLLAHKSER
jgi:hypothetical protein